MSLHEWTPPGRAADAAGALHEGVPPWMAGSLWRWLRRALSHRQNGATYLHRDLIEQYERMSRSYDPVSEWLANDGVEGLRVRLSEAETLQLVDFCIANADHNFVPPVEELEQVLSESGSAWKVGTRDGLPGLERRVPGGVQEAADSAMATPGHAGARLSEAWHKVYGVSPDPSSAYSLAVKAVEDAAVPVVVPKQSGATLGHVIGQLVNDGDWSLPLTREDPAAPTAETIVRMCKALWKGHHDRHGGDQTAPKSVNQDEAEAAVQMAVFLVQGFASGLIARR